MKTKFAFCSLVLVLATAAWADQPPVDSLNDLPGRWEGAAGDLFARTPATFSVDKILSVVREDKPSGFVAKYEVEGRLILGTRSVSVTKLELSASSKISSVYWVTLDLADALVPRIWAAVTYDEATDSYTLKEMPKQGGERRFL